MSTYANRHYYSALYHQSSLEGHWVKISYHPATINQSVSSTPQEYETRHYLHAEQAFMHAKGWVDCTLYNEGCKQTPKDNEDSYTNRLRELLDQLENNRFEQDINNSRASKEERELAYREGWKSKLEELNNREIRNPE